MEQRTVESIKITTDRLELRLMEPADAQDAFDTYTSDPQASRFMVFTTQTDVSEALQFITRQRTAFNDGKTILWAIRFKGNPALVGAIELHLGSVEGESTYRLRHDDGDAEVGFIIGKRYWGQGIVPEALLAIIEFARQNLRLRSIFGQCDIDNVQSARVFEKAGFANLGIVKKSLLHPQVSTELRDGYRFRLELGGA
jgi:[ribosomal protein S5]-alanine N-acetyltransferase